MNDQDIKNRIVRKMLRADMVGGHAPSKDAIINMALPSHEQGRGKQMLEELITDPAGPVQEYGGAHRCKLTSEQAAVDYLRDNGGDVPFGY